MSVKQKKATSLFPMDNNKKDRILTKFFYIVFQILKVLLIKICKIQPLDLLFLVVFISFYIIRYHFSQVFRTSFNIIWKKDFFTNFPFLTDSLTPPPSRPSPQQPKFFKRDKCLLSILPNLSRFFKIIMLWCN